MRPLDSFIGQPVRSLQTMLRVIAQAENRVLSVIPDGIYGRQTAAAISEFQRRNGLPISGITDQQTWDNVVRQYKTALTEVGKAQPVEVILNAHQVFSPGDSNPWIILSQSMLAVLSQHYHFNGAPTTSGCMDGKTCSCLKEFQRLSGLPATGSLDKMTWKHLSLQFSMAANSMKSD